MRVGLVVILNELSAATGSGKYVLNLLSALADLQPDRHPSRSDPEYVVLLDDGGQITLPPEVSERMTVVTESLRENPSRAEDLLEELDLDVVHFPIQSFVETEIPTVFNPCDLNHEYYPEHFTDEMLEARRNHYLSACQAATLIDTYSLEVKNQLVETYRRLDRGKIHPVPMGPALTPREGDGTESAEVDDRVPESFVLFPANLWPHKNHERLVEALERIERQHGERVPLVCTGIRDTPEVPPEHRLESVPEASQVLDLGYVTASELRALYRRSRLLVYPPLYEGGGLPVLEGWAFDTAVVCSDIPVLREKGGDAALYFDPESVPAMAAIIHEAWTDASLRAELIERGQERRELFTWERTARAYRALYRKAAGRALGEADREALAYPPEP